MIMLLSFTNIIYVTEIFTAQIYDIPGARGGQALIPALTTENKKIREFLVDLTIPSQLFDQLFRRVAGGKKKKVKLGKKKK